MGEMGSLTCCFFSVLAYATVSADPSVLSTVHVVGVITSQETSKPTLNSKTPYHFFDHQERERGEGERERERERGGQRRWLPFHPARSRKPC